ncbi:tetratricopeptide repeat protein [Desulfosarcina sp. OttesenSCG-928-G17]|nr:tetratricopeptide repeat protein [Desulfosarcina sp. OttesenSCG-928-G17]
MKWLHLSDLHFDPENAGFNTARLRKKLPDYINSAGIRADHLFFTGDFRNASRQEDSDEAAEAATEFLRRIAESAGITDPRRIHIVPGNHDLTRVDGDEGVNRLKILRQDYEKERNRPEGCFTGEELDHLLGRFGFFRRIVKALQPADVWKDSLLPLHPYACFDDFSLVYMNTAVTCGSDDDRGQLVIGCKDLYESLYAIKNENPGKPVIVLAHHSPQYFSGRERRNLETVFSDFSNLALYLCGDEHSPWSRAVNTLPQLTAGCLVQEAGTEVVFYTGELCNGAFVPPQAHRWDKNLSCWDAYPHMDTRIGKMIADIRNPFFVVPQINIVSNLDTLNIRLAEPFIGREKELESIRTTFQSGDTVFLTQSIKGLGGVGKTQIALKYAFSHEKNYKHVWWIDAATETAIIEGYRAFLEKIGVSMDPKAPPEHYIHAVRAWMRKNDNWLFIFDNADAYKREEKPVLPDKVLADYLPQNLDGIRHILITSRYGNWKGKTRDIEVFSPEDARDFLTIYTKLKHDAFQDELAEKLGCLPLALEQAAAYIRETKGSYERYLELFSKYSVEMLKRHPGEDDSKRIVYTTWDISKDQIKRESALQLLDLLSFFAPDNIDVSWFRNGTEHLPDPLKTDIQDELECGEILAELVRYSLITRRGEHLSLHRLVQEVIRGSLETEKQNEAAECCLCICESCLFWDFSTAESRRQFNELQPHLLSVLNASDDLLPETRAILCMFLGQGEYEQGSYDKALGWYEKALAIQEKVLGPDHPRTAVTYNNIAAVYDGKGEYDKALGWYEKALAIREKVLGPDHPDTATTYNNIAMVYFHKGEYDKALKEHEKALAIREKVLGPDHPDTAATYNNIAMVYAVKGEYDKALREYEKALAIREKVLGPEHPFTAATYNNIAGVYADMGEYEKALELYEKALAIWKKVLGPDHPTTATAYNNIAGVYADMSEYNKALEGYEKALAIWEKVLGPNHLDTATAYNNIATRVYDRKGEYDKALEGHVCAFRVFFAQIGHDHPGAITAFENILRTYAKSGKTEDFTKWLSEKLAESDRCDEKL